MKRSILVVLFAVLFLILGLPVLGIEWIVRKFNRRAADLSSLRIVQWAFKVMIWLSGVRLVISGRENIPADTPVLYIANHRSYFDIIIGYSQCPGLTGFISKDAMAKIPILKIWMERLYCLFLNREDPRDGMRMILTAISYVKEGVSMWIFPEGTRAKGKEMLPFRDGSFKIATKTGCPIIPVAFTNTADILENHMPQIKKTTVYMTYGSPIYPDSLEGDDRKHIGPYVQNIIREMLETQQAAISDF